MRRFYLFILLTLFSAGNFYARISDSTSTTVPERKQLRATRIQEKITIDGRLNEPAWVNNKNVARGFKERVPNEGEAPEYQTEVKILFTDHAVYVGAVMIDREPDLILKQLGNRDDNLNADKFSVGFDTYNKQQDAYVFSVTASGVQSDSRIQDGTYNAVWNSAVKINDTAWVAEIEIPYYALRFPATDIQNWGIQFEREFRRIREISQWSLVSRKENNLLSFWGELEGIEYIETPARLSFTPYATVVSTNASDPEYRPSLVAGMDLKLGLNDGFTLDATLLPDFSQVRSDNVIKNLDLNEVQFAEQRTFFQEGLDLFTKGDLFYSRRIGDFAMGYNSAGSSLDTNEVLVHNPTNARLLNATKISGRNKKGLGIGLLNAVIGNTYAIAEDTIGNSSRKILTNPMSNYNILSFDQNLGNNNSIFLINTNVTRGGGEYDANVSAGGFKYWTKNSTYLMQGSFKHSRIYFDQPFDPDQVYSHGMVYSAYVGKMQGRFNAALSTSAVSPNYNANDLGYTFRTNYRNYTTEFNYRKFEPFWIWNSTSTSLQIDVEQNYSRFDDFNMLQVNTETWATTRNFHTFYFQFETRPFGRKDYFATPDGNMFRVPGYVYSHIGVSSDYRRTIAIDGFVGVSYNNKYGGGKEHIINFAPIFRLSDHFKITPSLNFERKLNQVGFAWAYQDGDFVYGNRDVRIMTNILNGTYIFKNNLSLSLRFRHYWSSGVYNWYATLNENGDLAQHEKDYGLDFNFNAFNTDIVFAWQYGPGSFLTLVYKTILQEEANAVNLNYISNLGNAIQAEQFSTLSLRAIYFFDVNRLGNLKKQPKTY